MNSEIRRFQAILYIIGCAWLAMSAQIKHTFLTGFWLYLGIKFIVALLFGWIVFYLLSSVLHFSAKLFGGYGTLKDSWISLSWSFVPGIFAIVFYSLTILITKSGITNPPNATNGLHLMVYSYSNVLKLINLWSLFILISGIIYFYKLTVIEAMCTVFFPILIVSIIVFSFNFF